MNIIELVDLTKKFDKDTILDGINLYIKENEFLTLLGPSGCGKTTTLRLIGGFETPTSGEIYFDGRNVVNIPPYKRQINTVFQKYALFPHLNVEDNIGIGLKIKKVESHKIAIKVKNMLNLVNLKGFEKRTINSLSGGQQQRIAIARALINEPKVLLLDEPLGALDLKLRKDMQIELKNIQKRLGITFIYVTHDQEEALTMSDKIVVMDRGKIQQIGTPVDIYNEPKNAFVADFIGESNIIHGIMREDYLVEFFGQKWECVDHGFDKDEQIEVVVRPEDIEIVPIEMAKITAVVKSVIFKGIYYEMLLETTNFSLIIQSTEMEEVGSEIGFKIIPYNIHVMKKVTN